jgi:hypothetical protein
MGDGRLPRSWKIVISSSRPFPAGARVRLLPAAPDGSRHRFEVEWQEVAFMPLFETDLPPGGPAGAPRAFQGEFPGAQGQRFRLAAVLCPPIGTKGEIRHLFGDVQLLDGRDDPGATGVWVAEADDPKDDPAAKGGELLPAAG